MVTEHENFFSSIDSKIASSPLYAPFTINNFLPVIYQRNL